MNRWVAIAAVTMFGLLGSTQGLPQSQVQTSATAAPKYEYEVASIKPYKPDPSTGVMSGMSRPADGLLYTNFTLQALLRDAYGLQDNQISGLPDWARSEAYVIDARMDATTADALNKLNEADWMRARQQMLQALLADRFKLTLHRETRDLPVYSLVIAKSGFKLQPAPAGKVYPGASPGSVSSSTLARGVEKITGRAVPIVALTESLAQVLGRTVLDRTGLKDVYDFTLEWATSDSAQPLVADGTGSAPSEPIGATIFVAIQKQLGLKLESGKGPVEIIVIDHVERPSVN
jgi:uncharacterized protein (TIGR03435 family)